MCPIWRESADLIGNDASCGTYKKASLDATSPNTNALKPNGAEGVYYYIGLARLELQVRFEDFQIFLGKHGRGCVRSIGFKKF